MAEPTASLHRRPTRTGHRSAQAGRARGGRCTLDPLSEAPAEPGEVSSRLPKHPIWQSEPLCEGTPAGKAG